MAFPFASLIGYCIFQVWECLNGLSKCEKLRPVLHYRRWNWSRYPERALLYPHIRPLGWYTLLLALLFPSVERAVCTMLGLYVHRMISLVRTFPTCLLHYFTACSSPRQIIHCILPFVSRGKTLCSSTWWKIPMRWVFSPPPLLLAVMWKLHLLLSHGHLLFMCNSSFTFMKCIISSFWWWLVHSKDFIWTSTITLAWLFFWQDK